MNAALIERWMWIAIRLFDGGVEDNAAVASAAGMLPYNDLSAIDKGGRLRKEWASNVKLQYPIRCGVHRGRVTDVPCMTCNRPAPYENLHCCFKIDGADWHRDKFKIELAQKAKKDEQRAKVAAARATRKKKVTAKPKGAKRGED